MKIDANLSAGIGATTVAAAAVERDGYDGLWVGETRHDPFLQCLQAAMATSTVTVGTSIAIAFARTPMTLANVGYDLADVITDEMLAEFSIVGTPEQVGRGLADKIGKIYTRATLYTPYEADRAMWPALLDAVR